MRRPLSRIRFGSRAGVSENVVLAPTTTGGEGQIRSTNAADGSALRIVTAPQSLQRYSMPAAMRPAAATPAVGSASLTPAPVLC